MATTMLYATYVPGDLCLTVFRYSPLGLPLPDNLTCCGAVPRTPRNPPVPTPNR